MKTIWQQTKIMWWRIRYGVNFIPGYEYKMIKHTRLDLMEKHHGILISDGWEKFSDIEASFTSIWCWYRKK